MLADSEVWARKTFRARAKFGELLRPPQSAYDPGQCVETTQWSIDEADARWSRHERGLAQPSVSATATGGLTRPNSDHMQTIDSR
jgi:hypothetical protein